MIFIKYHLTLIHTIDQIGENEELLNTIRDFFRFVTRFFKPINVSATHIYHSALELSPLSSIVRKLYYHHRHTPFPRVVTGTQHGWNKSINILGMTGITPCTWSPCGQFVATATYETVVIWDPLSSELVSTLARPNADLTGQLTYSPDGCSLASLSNASLIIWDIQTGGVAKEVGCSGSNNVSLIWSLDGETICFVLQDEGIKTSYTVYVCDVASCTISSPGTLQSSNEPHLWASNISFWIMTTRKGDQTYTIEISEVGSVLTKIESCCIGPWRQDVQIESFSPTTYRVSISDLQHQSLLDHECQSYVLDIRKSDCLLQEKQFVNHCFSPDGSLFAACSDNLHIWKYTSSHYTPWREFPPQDLGVISPSPLQFSPTSSSILGCPYKILQVWQLDDPLIVVHSNSHTPLTVLSCYGTYMATCCKGDSTVTIANFHLQVPSQFVDTDMEVEVLALTDNILLVLGGGVIKAWRLTEEGVVDGIVGERRAGCSDSIWTVPVPSSLMASIVNQTAIILEESEMGIVQAFHTGTGEVLKPTQVPQWSRASNYLSWADKNQLHHLHRCELDEGIPPEGDWPISQDTLLEGWVKDPEGRHQLWIPVEWRKPLYPAEWYYETKILRFRPTTGERVAIVF